MNSRETVAEWVERIRAQAERFVSFDGENAARVVNNLDWTKDVNVIDFLRDIGKHFPVNRMLDRQVVSSRLESGISYTEFSYVLLQSMDYLELFRRYGTSLQTGGSDQWGNITAGVELIRRADGAKVHALATPLITKADGTKFGKSTGGALWLDPQMLSPYAFYQTWIQAEDSKVIEYLKQFTFLDLAEIEEIAAEAAEKPALRLAQRRLAAEVTSLVHGPEETRAAELASAALFGRGELADLRTSTLRAALAEAGMVQVPPGTTVVDALVRASLVDSRSAARRAVTEGGAYLNNHRVDDVDTTLDAFALDGLVALRRGKKAVAGAEIVDAVS